MRKLIVEASKTTPQIILDPIKGYFLFEGRSFPENSKKFYAPILEWFEGFEPLHNKDYKLEFNLSYISSSSIISIFELLKKVHKLDKLGNIAIFWKHEHDDESIRQIGEDFTKLAQVSLTLEAISTS